MTANLFDKFKSNLNEGLPVALATIIKGTGQGSKLLLLPDGTCMGSLGNPKIDRVLSRDMAGELAAGRTSIRHYGQEGEAREESLSIFIESFALLDNDLIIVPLMCILCVAIPFVLVTIAPRFIPAAEVNLFFLLETIIGPIWVWLIIKEQPSIETLQGGVVIIATIAIHSFLKLKKS